MSRVTKRRVAHQKLDEYIDMLRDDYMDGGNVAAIDGTDGWTLLIDQLAHAAAKEESRRKR